MKKATWNTYRTSGYTHDVAQDRASAGGVHYHQVRRTGVGWQKRIVQSNGHHTAYGEVTSMSDADGESAYFTAKSL